MGFQWFGACILADITIWFSIYCKRRSCISFIEPCSGLAIHGISGVGEAADGSAFGRQWRERDYLACRRDTAPNEVTQITRRSGETTLSPDAMALIWSPLWHSQMKVCQHPVLSDLMNHTIVFEPLLDGAIDIQSLNQFATTVINAASIGKAQVETDNVVGKIHTYQ